MQAARHACQTLDGHDSVSINLMAPAAPPLERRGGGSSRKTMGRDGSWLGRVGLEEEEKTTERS